MLVGNVLGFVFVLRFALSEAVMALCPCIWRFVDQSNFFFGGLFGLFLQSVGDEFQRPNKLYICVH